MALSDVSLKRCPGNNNRTLIEKKSRSLKVLIQKHNKKVKVNLKQLYCHFTKV